MGFLYIISNLKNKILKVGVISFIRGNYFF